MMLRGRQASTEVHRLPGCVDYGFGYAEVSAHDDRVAFEFVGGCTVYDCALTEHVGAISDGKGEIGYLIHERGRDVGITRVRQQFIHVSYHRRRQSERRFIK